MTVAFLGSYTLGECLPGPMSVLTQLATVMDGLQVAVASARSQLVTLEESLNEQIAALLDAKISIRIPAVVDFETQLNACADMTAALGVQVTDPAAYLAIMVNGIAQVQANILAISPPSIAITGQISAMVAISAGLGLKIGAVDLQLALLDAIAAALTALVSLAAGVSAALLAALAGVVAALSAYLDMAALLAASGVMLFAADSTVGTIGGELAAALPGTGLGAGVALHGPVLVVQSGSSSGVAAVDGVFKMA